MISVSSAGDVWELTCLVGVEGVNGVVHADDADDDVIDFLERYSFFCWFHFYYLLRRSDSLSLSSHVTLLGFFRLWEVLVDVFYVDHWPGVVIAVAYCLKPCCFCWETCRCMLIFDRLFYA